MKKERIIRKYFSTIGRRGGLRSRRVLKPEDARRMVRFREAKKAYRQFYARCFWSWPQNQKINSEETILEIICGLRENGGREGWDQANTIEKCR
ncbi:MAG: hypothetical protein PHD76_08795 [Methylacidiphilales bacterium]|nr:hypothetical protein [Candidatus Methylacidiphilales bacterium]